MLSVHQLPQAGAACLGFSSAVPLLKLLTVAEDQQGCLAADSDPWLMKDSTVDAISTNSGIETQMLSMLEIAGLFKFQWFGISSFALIPLVIFAVLVTFIYK